MVTEPTAPTPLTNVLLDIPVFVLVGRVFFVLLMVPFLQALPYLQVYLLDVYTTLQSLPGRWKWFGSARLDLRAVWIMTLRATVNDPFALPVGHALTVSARHPVVVPLHVTTGADVRCIVKINILTE